MFGRDISNVDVLLNKAPGELYSKRGEGKRLDLELLLRLLDRNEFL